jgi:hypothetical protein
LPLGVCRLDCVDQDGLGTFFPQGFGWDHHIVCASLDDVRQVELHCETNPPRPVVALRRRQPVAV